MQHIQAISYCGLCSDEKSSAEKVMRTPLSREVLLVLGDRQVRLEQLFERVEYMGSSDHPWALERNISVFYCRGARFGSLAQVWPQLKR
jgi:hypothetical protein